jgi:hypothetical protein
MTENATTMTPQCRQQRCDADDNSVTQTTGDDTDDDDADDKADNDADVNTEDNTATQMMDDDADDNAREVKTIGGTLEAKMGRGGGCWGRQGGHWGRQGCLI